MGWWAAKRPMLNVVVDDTYTPYVKSESGRGPRSR